MVKPPKKTKTIKQRMLALERKMLPLYKKGDTKRLAKLYKSHDELNRKLHVRGSKLKPANKLKPAKPAKPMKAKFNQRPSKRKWGPL